MRLGPCAHYQPDKFAALVITLCDATTQSTTLMFSTGSFVVVSALTPNHTRYISQLVRYIAEQVQCVMDGGAGGVPALGSLVGRTVFQHSRIQNIVGHSFLGHRIELQRMCDTAPSCCKWFPDLFPGLKCKIWLTTEYACVCATTTAARGGGGGGVTSSEISRALALAKVKQPKCACSVKALIFDTGKIVITGGRSVSDINSVFFRIHSVSSAFAQHAQHEHTDRFYERLATMMVPSNLANTKKSKKLAHKPISTSEALAHVFGSISTTTAPSGGSGGGGVKPRRIPPVIRLALDGRVADLRAVLAMDPTQADTDVDEEGRTALQRVSAIPVHERSADHQQVIQLLQQKQ